MARIVIGSYVVRFPLGGYLSWVLQWALGLQRMGHDVYVFEKAGWADACFDPSTGRMSDDCAFGMATVDAHLRRFGLGDRLCFVDVHGRHHGLESSRAGGVIHSADLLLDMGAHGSWNDDATNALRVQLDGEAGFTQMKLVEAMRAGEPLPEYDHYYTVGLNVGTSQSAAPTAGKDWRPFLDPVALDVYAPAGVNGGMGYTTVMSWQAHKPLEFEGKTYGQKDVEFAKFADLPGRVDAHLEIAVAGKEVPEEDLRQRGWHLRDAHDTTVTFDAWRDYIAGSRGEFSVVKNVFVETWSGWFSDRSACYLASGRPVVLQDTGWSEHLPTGEGLFAVRNTEEAAAAIEAIESDYGHHSRAARRIAEEHLSTDVVLPRLLVELGVS